MLSPYALFGKASPHRLLVFYVSLCLGLPRRVNGHQIDPDAIASFASITMQSVSDKVCTVLFFFRGVSHLRGARHTSRLKTDMEKTKSAPPTAMNDPM